MSARRATFARGRTVMIAAAFIALWWIAGGDRAAAQFAPPGPQEQAPYPSFEPFPSPPPPAQAETPAAPTARANEERYVARPHRLRRKLVEQKRPLVAPKQKIVKRKQSRKKFAGSDENQRELAESKGYKRVSDLVNFPKFFPGLGIIYVRPDTLPTGPYLCFDREDRLVATVYMVSLKDIGDHKALDATGVAAPGVTAPVDHVSFYFNSGHPGMDMPHYHFVIWHVSKKDEARVAQ